MKFERSRRVRRLFAATLAGMAITAPAALAASQPDAEAPTPKMSVSFTKATAATVAGTRALVAVRCDGIVSRECVGTLALETAAGTEKVAYSIAAGEKRTVVVPLPAAAVSSAKAVAETMQLEGASTRTSRVLRIK
jgi:hypothetical protein